MLTSGSTTALRHLLGPKASDLAQYHPESRSDPSSTLESLQTDNLFFGQRADASTASTEVSFGPFRLLVRQFLLLDGDESVSLGSRALEILIVLLERPGELISKQDLMARVWPNVFVEPANLTVHISALRRALRDGREGNRFIINIPGRGYKFVGSVVVARHPKTPLAIVSRNVSEIDRPLQTNDVTAG